MTERPHRLGAGRRAAPGALARGALCLGLVTALAACSPSAGPTPTPVATASPAASPSPATTAALAAAARTGTAVRSGALTLTVAAVSMPVAVQPHDDGSVGLTITVPVAAADAPAAGTTTVTRRVVAVLAAPSGLRFEAETDQSVRVVGSTGAVVGALPRVGAVDGAGARRGAVLAPATDRTLLDVVLDGTQAGSAIVTFGATPLVGADWGNREGGRSLAVVPAAWVRSGGLAAQDALWSALVTAQPDADSTTMHDQLSCHALWAPDKASWNLEPWRPVVDSITMLTTGCNPKP